MMEQFIQHRLYDRMPNGLGVMIREFLFLQPSEKLRELVLEGKNMPNSEIQGCAVLFIPSAKNPHQILMLIDDDKTHLRFAQHINDLAVPTDIQWEESIFPYSKAFADRCSPVAGIIYTNKGTMLRMAGDLPPHVALQKIQTENKQNLVRNN